MGFFFNNKKVFECGYFLGVYIFLGFSLFGLILIYKSLSPKMTRIITRPVCFFAHETQGVRIRVEINLFD